MYNTLTVFKRYRKPDGDNLSIFTIYAYYIILQLWSLFVMFPNFSDMQAIVEVDLITAKENEKFYDSLLTENA